VDVSLHVYCTILNQHWSHKARRRAVKGALRMLPEHCSNLNPVNRGGKNRDEIYEPTLPIWVYPSGNFVPVMIEEWLVFMVWVRLAVDFLGCIVVAALLEDSWFVLRIQDARGCFTSSAEHAVVDEGRVGRKNETSRTKSHRTPSSSPSCFRERIGTWRQAECAALVLDA